MFCLGLQTFKTAAKIITQSNPAVFSFPYIKKVWDSLNAGGLRNESNTAEFDIYIFCKSPLQFNTISLEVYLKLKFKLPEGIILPITAFPFNKRVKKCTGLVIFGRSKYDDTLRELIFTTKF